MRMLSVSLSVLCSKAILKGSGFQEFLKCSLRLTKEERRKGRELLERKRGSRELQGSYMRATRGLQEIFKRASTKI